MNKKLILVFMFLILVIPAVKATCTVSFDDTVYSEGETVTASMQCSENTEKNTAYTLNWTNGSGYQVEVDTGTTPPKAGNGFFQGFTINSTYVETFGTTINANLTGTGLEGTDSATVQSAQASDLIIDNITFTKAADIFIGKNLGVHADVKDDNNKKVNGAQCSIILEDGNGFPILSRGVVSNRGIAIADFLLDIDNFDEGREYVAIASCYCPLGTSNDACTDEDGNLVNSSDGSRQEGFITNTWFTVNTITDASSYIMKEEIFICANVTNVAYADRVAMEITSEVRCSPGNNNDFDTDRALIISDFQSPDMRGISNGTTQMQCKKFIIPEPKHLQGVTSQCYASTDVVVIDENAHRITSYHTTSSLFNITSDELNIYRTGRG